MATDTLAAAAHRNALAHLVGPLSAGAVETPLAVAADGTVAVDFSTREPLLLVAPLADLDEQTLTITATPVGSDGRLMAPAVFAPWTPRGATVPLFVPAVDPVARTAQSCTLKLTATTAPPGGAATAVAAAAIAGLVEVRMIEGVIGRLGFMLTAEQQRMRRTMRTLMASRRVATAGGDALDRIGADLAVPRFADELTFDAGSGTIVPQTVPGGEPDSSYRRRLATRRPTVMPDGPGVSGLLAAAGIANVTFAEVDAPFPVAIRVCGVGASAAAGNLFEHIRQTYLVLIDSSAAADTIHHARLLGPDQLAAVDALRARLLASYTVPANAAAAPFLADALDLAASCRSALLGSGAAKLTITRTVDTTAGSRYELGLGCDVTIPAAAELTAMSTALGTVAAPADAAVAGALDAMRANLAAHPADSAGAWFWTACGMRTVEQIDATTTYLSTAAVGPLTIEGTAQAAAGTPITLQAVRRASDSPDADALLARSVAGTLAAWTAASHPAWTPLSAADAATAWKAAIARPLSDPVGEALAAAGLPAITDPADAAARLALIPPALIATVRLAPADATAILAHDTAAVDALRTLTAAARTAGVPAMLVLTSATDVDLVFAATGLPVAGVNLGDRAAGAIRWALVPLAGAVATLAPAGQNCTVTAGGESLALAVAVSGARVGASDPYEAAVVLPDAQLLGLDDYELTMNTLDRACPIGTRINTWTLRKQHVDLDGDGRADPLTPSLAETYRWYRRSRYRGEGPPGTPAA